MGFFGDDTQYNAASNLAAQSRASYGKLGGQLGEQDDYLKRIASGQESVSAGQLKDSLGQNLNAQRSMAASAAPRDSTMAALMASRNAMAGGAALAGQQARAGILERQAAQGQLMESLMRRRQQEADMAARAQQMAIATQPPSFLDRFGGAIIGAGTIGARALGYGDLVDGPQDRR